MTVTLPDELGTVTVTYKSPTAQSALGLLDGAGATGMAPIEKLARDLAGVIESWDVTNPEGSPVEPTYEVLAVVDVTILNAISSAIVEHLYPPRKASGS